MRLHPLAVLVLAAALAVAGCQATAAPLSHLRARASDAASSGAAHPPHVNGDVALGEDDGVAPQGATVFTSTPAVTRLDPRLLRALRRAARGAARQHVVLYVDSGWRSRRYQEQLLRQAVATYGSRASAARWVATPDTSAHVSGDAVDVGGERAREWLSRHGARYALCQTYRNEPWHYELRSRAVVNGCPRPYADPTHDPRMQ